MLIALCSQIIIASPDPTEEDEIKLHGQDTIKISSKTTQEPPRQGGAHEH